MRAGTHIKRAFPARLSTRYGLGATCNLVIFACIVINEMYKRCSH